MPSGTIKRMIRRPLPDRGMIEITVELREDDPRGLSDAFSVTGAVYEAHGTWSGEARWRNDREADSFGCVHEDVLRAAPELAPLVALHLAAPDGEPMHAEANGWYLYSGDSRRYEETSRYPGSYNREGLTDHERAARALRVTPDELPEELDREGFAAFVAGLRERWQREAEEGRALLLSLPTE